MAPRQAISAFFTATLVAAFVAALSEPGAAAIVDVDVELVLAVDISHSMKEDEQDLQRRGYIAALTSPDFLAALKNGPHGRVAITYIEWAEAGRNDVLIDWTLVENEASARSLAERLEAMPLNGGNFTSISNAISFSVGRFGKGGFSGQRRVIDISGDGTNNHGPPLTQARSAALAAGVTINGLPVLIHEGQEADSPHLAEYYAQCVIGGDGSFVEPVASITDFERAVREKLVREVASATPEISVKRAAYMTAPDQPADCSRRD